MPRPNNRAAILAGIAILSSLVGIDVRAMGLRSLVALPVDKGGSVVRLTLESADEAATDVLIANLAYGIGARQTLLLGLPYRLDPGSGDRSGDGSLLYRHIVRQRDNFAGTRRLGLLVGALTPAQSDSDSAAQVGAVFTWFENRDEFDADLVCQAGNGERAGAARYDLSWQHRLHPASYPEWGPGREWHGVLEPNGRWCEDEDIIHQATVGLQWIHPRAVLEGGYARDIRNGDHHGDDGHGDHSAYDAESLRRAITGASIRPDNRSTRPCRDGE